MQDAVETKNRVYCFVCTGNTCRSPMAAAVLNRYGASHGIYAISRGIMAASGAPISENAAAALADAGIAPTGHNAYDTHRAMQVCEADIEACDGIFAISPRHAEMLLMAFPFAAGKIRTLGDIADPYGGDLATYKACLAEITEALRLSFPEVFTDAI